MGGTIKGRGNDTAQVPHFVKVGDHVQVDTETHKHHGKQAGKH